MPPVSAVEVTVKVLLPTTKGKFAVASPEATVVPLTVTTHDDLTQVGVIVTSTALNAMVAV